jgi:hypothetical protein
MRVLVQGLSVFASASEPRGDGGLSVAEDPFGGGSIQAFGECREYHGDVMGRGFQSVQGSIESGTEGGMAGLTPMCVVCQEGKNLPFF